MKWEHYHPLGYYPQFYFPRPQAPLPPVPAAIIEVHLKTGPVFDEIDVSFVPTYRIRLEGSF